MAISGINGNSMQNIYGQLSSGKRINKAADGAAEMAIIQKEKAQINGMDAGSNNIQSGINALNISDGALGQVADYLQNIRELSIKAGNGLLGADDRKFIQNQIDQYKQGINDIVGTATYNEMHLLNGEKENFDVVTDSNGGKIGVGLSGSLADQLGINDYSVASGKFDMRVIDNALKTVNSMRSKVGSQTNALTAAYNLNQNTSYNMTSSMSKLEDLDIPKAISEKKKKQTLQEYAIMMQKKKMEEEEKRTTGLFKNM